MAKDLTRHRSDFRRAHSRVSMRCPFRFMSKAYAVNRQPDWTPVGVATI
jgi:hypothetical protein